MASQSRIQLEEYLKNLDVKAINVLDVGGSAYPVKGRTKSWDVKNYKILDNKIEEKWKGDKWREPDYIWDINKPIQERYSSALNHKLSFGFNQVFMLEVMEYVYNPYTAIKNCFDFLDFNGKLTVTSQFIYPYHNPVEYDYLRLTDRGLARIFKEVGFKRWKFIPRTARNEGLLNAFYSGEGMHCAKGERHDITGHIAEVWK